MSTRTAKSLVTEGVVIVLSILLAFAIDAAWAERVERGEEERLLGQLATELERYANLLDLADREAAETGQAVEMLLRGVHEGLPLDREGFSNALRQSLYRFRLGNATGGTYELLAGPGNLGVISSPELRRAVTRVAFTMTVVESFEDEEGDFIDGYLRPYLRMHLDDFAVWGNDQGEPAIASRFSWSPETVLADREFSNLMVERRRHVRLTSLFRSNLGDALMEARSALENRR